MFEDIRFRNYKFFVLGGSGYDHSLLLLLLLGNADAAYATSVAAVCTALVLVLLLIASSYRMVSRLYGVTNGASFWD